MQERIHFDDVPDGATFRSSRRTLTEADIVNFAGLSGDFNPLHVDEVFAREESPFGRRIAHGLLCLSIGSGLRSQINSWHILAFLECRRRFTGPVFAGDTIHAEYEVTERRASTSKPDRGIVTLAVKLVNDRGETVQEGENVLLLRRRPS